MGSWAAAAMSIGFWGGLDTSSGGERALCVSPTTASSCFSLAAFASCLRCRLFGFRSSLLPLALSGFFVSLVLFGRPSVTVCHSSPTFSAVTSMALFSRFRFRDFFSTVGFASPSCVVGALVKGDGMGPVCVFRSEAETDHPGTANMA